MPVFNVLIVDDSPFMRKVFSDVIDADAAFKVLATASNGKEAVELALKLKPDIITMDLEMPQMNGIEALRRIMGTHPTPVIMLSAVTDNGTRDTIRALQYGAFDFIRKPDGAVKLDIHQVGEQLLEKLHIAMDTVVGGSFRMLPAVEEAVAAPPPETANPPAGNVSPEAKAQTSAAKPAPAAPKPKIQQDKPASPPSSGQDGQRETEKNITPLPPPIKKLTSLEERVAGMPVRNKPILPRTADRKPVAAAPSPSDIKPPVIPANRPETIGRPSKPAAAKAARPVPERTAKPAPSAVFSHIVAIGTSTGGPRALHEVLTSIPADFPAPILVVQHMPPKFTHSLAQRLDSFCSIHVREASDGEPVETGTAYIAPGGRHMKLARDGQGAFRIKLSDEAQRSGHRPSVDVLFESLIGHPQLKRHAVLMTGMGSDGARGMKALQADGALTTIAEAEQTCVVYGMPRSAVELGAVSHLLPLQQIAAALVQEVKFHKK